MNVSDWGGLIRGISSLVVTLQIVGAVFTFKPMRERRVGLSSLFVAGLIAVLAGAQRSGLFVAALIPGMLGLAGGVALFAWARMTVHGLFFSYINSTDVPRFVCTSGPYHWIRHPFYSSYLLSLLAITIMFPNLVTVGGIIVAFLTLNSAAAFEERKFQSSPVASEYADYVRRTGRFVPGFHG